MVDSSAAGTGYLDATVANASQFHNLATLAMLFLLLQATYLLRFIVSFSFLLLIGLLSFQLLFQAGDFSLLGISLFLQLVHLIGEFLFNKLQLLNNIILHSQFFIFLFDDVLKNFNAIMHILVFDSE